MDISFSISDTDLERACCRIYIEIGDLCARSYSQTFFENLRDLQANRKMLLERKLAKFFFGDEPILNLLYKSDTLITAYIFQEAVVGNKKVESDFSIRDALSSLDETVNKLENMASISEVDRNHILTQVFKDFELGVYDIYAN